MSTPSRLYEPSLALLTDLYELTMAQAYWSSGLAEREAVFCLTFRTNPFNSGYSVACGLAHAVDYLKHFRFKEEDIKFLAGLTGNDGKMLFQPAFLDDLRGMSFDCDVDAMPEGTVAFPQEPLVRVKGPILQGQILETPLLNIINFQTLIATKAARICQAAKGEPVLEFGLRRAQGVDGGLAASRAAYIGGCAATSNVLAAKEFGIPVKGTIAHSWVMAFEDELEAFSAYANAMPNNCVFLVDTYDSLDGVRRAIEVGKKLKAQGHRMIGVRLDSGDLAYLSVEARRLLDEAGFTDAEVVASNDLDEHIITSLRKEQGAAIDVWGVGTKLVTAFDQPAMGGVYKLSALRDAEGQWQHRIKLSEQVAKISSPGMLQVRRYREGNEFIADMIYDELLGVAHAPLIIDPMDPTRRRRIKADLASEELLTPIFRKGECVAAQPTIEQIRNHREAQLSLFHKGVKRLVNPHRYPVGLEERLHELRTRLVLSLREKFIRD